MVQKTQRQPRRTDQEWLSIIQECRASGMTDKVWCDLHHFHRSTFYYHIRRLRNHACTIPCSTIPVVQAKQELIQVPFQTPELFQMQAQTMGDTLEFPSEATIRLTFHGIQIEITNSAAGETIRKTIAALQDLC